MFLESGGGELEYKIGLGNHTIWLTIYTKINLRAAQRTHGIG